jgi:hypothetical protein
MDTPGGNGTGTRFFQQFADQCHHAKEEDVFLPVLKERGLPDQRGCFRTTRGRPVRPAGPSVSRRRTGSTEAGLRETRVRGDPAAKGVGPRR